MAVKSDSISANVRGRVAKTRLDGPYGAKEI